MSKGIKIPEGWEVVSFEKSGISLIDGDRGKNYPKRGDFSDIGYCLFLNTKNVPGRKFDFSVKQFISKEKDSLLGKGKLTRNDIVMTTRGTVGNVALYDEKVPFEHIRINSGMLIIRADKKEFDSKYLFYYMTSPFFKKEIKRLSTGTAQPQLPIKNLRKALVIKPPLPEQQKIAEILGSIDDQIENLMEQNKTLEEIARTIFKRWFIDFEFPNEEGKPYKSSGGEFVDSELGKIPKGWKVGVIKDLIRDTIGGDWGKEKEDADFNQQVYVIRGTDFKDVKYGLLTNVPVRFMKQSSLKKRQLQDGYIIVEISGGSKGQPTGRVLYISQSLIHSAKLPLSFSNYCRKITVDTTLATPEFVYYYWNFLYEKGVTENFQTESTGISNFQYKSFINCYRITVPDIRVQKKFSDLIRNFLNKSQYNQIQTLTQLRDTLLPKLITGEIRVKV